MKSTTGERAGRSTAVMDMETCPYCGKAMEETLRAEEKSGLFVWYKCADDTCSGQSLKSYKIL